jgi:alpha-beta hydrolase superfamily lysophospholipase
MKGDPRRPRRIALAVAILLAPALCAWTASWRIPVWAAHGMLHPPRRTPPPETELAHEDLVLESGGARLVGWRFHAEGERRGLVVYLHGLCDDRREAIGLARKYTPRGFDVVAYDSRAHGESGGDACTYGPLEKLDLARILDREGILDRERGGPVALIGGSLGGAVALEVAAEDPRISLVVAIAPFSDLHTLEIERAPWYATASELEEAFRIGERECGLRVDAGSPVSAARRIRCPVLLVHGTADTDTPPSHSQRILAALSGRKRLILEPGLGHHDPLGTPTWEAIDEAVLAIADPSGADRPH